MTRAPAFEAVGFVPFGIHPTVKGHEKRAENIEDELIEVLRKAK